ncbi:MAG: DUF805 domain-containing protein [Rhodobacteraceae bacterium]|nr:DUF805 domain-containing protein [Paracoccaceae bacterium]
MIDVVKRVLGRYATFSGRASRRELWMWVLFVFIFIAALRIIDGALIAPLLGFGRFQAEGGQPLSTLVSLAMIIPNLAVGARRLHDTGRSGWLLLIGLIPILGFLVLLYFYIQPSEDGDNGYGAPDPI